MKIIIMLILIAISTPTFALIENKNIMNEDIRNEVLQNVNIVNSNIVDSDVSQSSIVDSNVRNSNLVNVDIDNTALVGVSLGKSKIKDSTIVNASVISSTIARSNASSSILADSFVDSSSIINTHFNNSNLVDTKLIGKNSFDGVGTCNADCENKLVSNGRSNANKEVVNNPNTDRQKEDRVITNNKPNKIIQPENTIIQTGETAVLEQHNEEKNTVAVFIQDKISNTFAGITKFINFLATNGGK